MNVLTSPPLELEVVAPRDLTAADRAAWLALQASHPGLASPFLSPQWAELLSALDGPDRAGGRVVVLRRGGRAVGFLPARVARATAMPIGSPFCDYQALVAAPDTAAPARQLVEALGVSRLDLHNALDQPAFAPHFRSRCDSWVIDLSGGFEHYAADRRAAGTDILRDCAKKRRKLEREHGAVVFAPLSDDRGAFDQLFAWKRGQLVATRQTDLFHTPWAMRLMEAAFAARDDQDFGGGLFTLHAGDRLVAAQFALRGRGALHAWMIAHDAEFARYSPGAVLLADILGWAPQAGFRELDLGPGDYRFKTSFANTKRAVAEGFVGRPSAAALVRAAEYGVCRVAEALPLGAASRLPGKVMRRLDLIRALG